MDSFATALRKCAKELSPFLPDLYGEHDEDCKIIIKFISEQKGGIGVTEMKHLLVEEDLLHVVPKVETICADLEKCEILEKKADGRYHLQDLIYANYVLRGDT